MSNSSYNSLGLSPHDHKVLLKPQVLSAHSRQGQVNIRGVTEPHLNLPFYQKSKIFPRYFQHTSTYISLAKMCLNTRETKKNEYLGTASPNKSRNLLAKQQQKEVAIEQVTNGA